MRRVIACLGFGLRSISWNPLEVPESEELLFINTFDPLRVSNANPELWKNTGVSAGMYSRIKMYVTL